jgi:hypothetical protein
MNTSKRQTKSNLVAALFHETVLHGLLFVAVVGVLVDRAVALTNGTII